jgi:hypothetical protein
MDRDPPGGYTNRMALKAANRTGGLSRAPVKVPRYAEPAGLIHTHDGEAVSETEVRQHLKVESPEGLPPPESLRRREFFIFWSIFFTGSTAVITTLYFTFGLVAALTGAVMLICYACIGGLSRWLTDTLREVERQKVVREVRQEHVADPPPPHVVRVEAQSPRPSDDDERDR